MEDYCVLTVLQPRTCAAAESTASAGRGRAATARAGLEYAPIVQSQPRRAAAADTRARSSTCFCFVCA